MKENYIVIIDSNKVINDIKKECFIQELSKLKESSKEEAVEGLNKFSKFKNVYACQIEMYRMNYNK